jgi:hypothetical protein
MEREHNHHQPRDSYVRLAEAAAMADQVRASMLVTASLAASEAFRLHPVMKDYVRSLYPDQPEQAFAQLEADLAKYTPFRADYKRATMKLLTLPGRKSLVPAMLFGSPDLRMINDPAEGKKAVNNQSLEARHLLGPVIVSLTPVVIEGGLGFGELKGRLVQYSVLTAFDRPSQTGQMVRANHVGDEELIYASESLEKLAKRRLASRFNPALVKLIERHQEWAKYG